MGFNLITPSKHVNLSYIDFLSLDEKDFLSLFEEHSKVINNLEISFHPRSFSDINSDELEYSHITLDFYYGDFEINIFFKNGIYSSWFFSDKNAKKDSNGRNAHNKNLAKEDIVYILNEYKKYESAKFNIVRFCDDYFRA